MTLTDLDIAIDWMKTSGIKSVQLIGGEPMINPNVLKIIEKIVGNEIQIRCVLTNGLADTELYKKAREITGTHWLVNINNPHTYTEGEWKMLNRNLDLLRWNGEDKLIGHERDDQAYLSLQLSITFYEKDQDYTYIIDLAKKYGCTFIRYAPAHPSADKSNIHFDFERLAGFKNTLMSFFKSCVREEIKPTLECPLPPCIFTSKEMSFLLRFTGSLKFSCTPHLDVAPDLTVGYCASMRKILPAYSIKDWDAQEILKMQNNDAKIYKDYTLPRCKGCYYFLNKICQGFCLRFKADHIKSKEIPILNSVRKYLGGSS